MKYKVTHTTKYHYDTPVAVCQNIVYLTAAHARSFRPVCVIV